MGEEKHRSKAAQQILNGLRIGYDLRMAEWLAQVVGEDPDWGGLWDLHVEIARFEDMITRLENDDGDEQEEDAA
jgi:hypothetical protein